jgi:hypothetical protein
VKTASGWIELASVATVRTVPNRVEVRASDKEKSVVVSVMLLVIEDRATKLGRKGERGGGKGADGELGRIVASADGSRTGLLKDVARVFLAATSAGTDGLEPRTGGSTEGGEYLFFWEGCPVGENDREFKRFGDDMIPPRTDM